MHLVPAHVWHFQLVALRIGQTRGKSPDLPGEHPETRCITLFAVLEKHLEAHANAEKRLSFPDHIRNHAIEATRTNFAHTVRCGALPRENDPSGRGNHSGLAGHGDVSIWRNFAHSLLHRAQVAHTVIDDCDINHGVLTGFPWWKA